MYGQRTSRICSGCLAACLLVVNSARAADWPCYGRDATRNAVSPEKNPPTDWHIGQPDHVDERDRNVKWKARLGSAVIGSPVVAGGLVWVCSNNEAKYDSTFAKDAGVLLCFDERDGSFLWQHLTQRVGDRVHDWPYISTASPPLVEGERLWYLTNRWEVVCLDIGPLLKRTGQPREVWKLDMPRELGVFGHCPSMATNVRCAIGPSYKGMIYIITGNGVGADHRTVPAPDAPSLVCLDKDTGRVIWTDNSPGEGILQDQVSSPIVAEINGRAQVIAPQGDGWIRSFDPVTGKLIWEFDANPKESVYPRDRNELMAMPVLYENRLYIGLGQSVEHGEGPGLLWCIDTTREGDVSEHLDGGPDDAPRQDDSKTYQPAGGRRRTGPANPNSAVVWKFDRFDINGDGKVRASERMNRTASSVVAADGLVVAADFSGFAHCLDARTGRPLWVHDLEAAVVASPMVCDGKVYIADEDGDVATFALSREKKLLAEHNFGTSVYSAPVFANGVLYIAARGTLYAIGSASDPTAADGEWPQYRGPGRTNVSPDTALLSRWPADGPPLAWKAAGLGEGVPSVAVSAGRVYTLGYRDGGEWLTAWAVASGQKLWQARIGPAVEEMRAMRWLSQRTPTVDGDRVYAFTARGELICLATAEGAERWRKDYVNDFGGKANIWGYCDFPLVDGGQLICTPGGKDGAVLALNKWTGEVLWKCAVPKVQRSTYGAAVVATIAGVRQYVHQLDQTAAGISAGGKLLWQHPLPARMGNVHTALVRGDEVFLSVGWGGGDALVKLTRDGEKFSVGERHRGNPKAFDPWLGNSALLGGHVYTNAGFCIEWSSGKQEWEAGFRPRIAMVAADCHLYYRFGDGTVVMAEANPQKYVEVARFLPPRPETKEPAWSSPVVIGGMLYLRDQDQLLCYDLRQDRTRPVPGATAQQPVAVRPTAPVDADAADERRKGRRDAIFVPTPQDVVEKMLELAAVTKDDIVYDLGCGDGRIVVTAASRYGCRAAGYDLDPECVRLSQENVEKQKVGGLVRIQQKDLFSVDLSAATVVTLYLGRDVNRRLLPQLEKLRRGARVVSHMFEIEGFEPEKVVEVVSAEDDTKHTLYLWTAPLKRK